MYDAGMFKAAFMKTLFWRRVWALLIDLVAGWIGLVALMFLLKIVGFESVDNDLMVDLMLAFCAAAFLFKDGWGGQSVGKRFMKVRVVSLLTGKPIGFMRSFSRNFLFVFYSFVVLVVGAWAVNLLSFVFERMYVPFGASRIMFDIAMAVVLVRVWAFELFNAKNNDDGLKLSDRHSGTKVVIVGATKR